MESVRKGPQIFLDPIHGSIEIPELCVMILDAPQFQRLRYIKQLSGCSYVYPAAVHTRFEHSLGVCYLAGQLVRYLRDNQPELGISDVDVLCVEIAGLCHDLGHGPFSHLFQSSVIPCIFEDETEIKHKTHKHEEYSKLLFEYILKKNHLIPMFDYNGLDAERREFITDLFTGFKNKNYKFIDHGGGSKDKTFLYEIVANERTGIDVDKWDYFARDCHMLGFQNDFDHKRTIKMARVFEVEGKQHICFRDKVHTQPIVPNQFDMLSIQCHKQEAINLYDMFYKRLNLQRKVYQHETAAIVHYMIRDAMVKALKAEAIKFTGKDGVALSVKEVLQTRDLKAFCQMTDGIVDQIKQSDSSNIAMIEAQSIIRKLDTRNLYVLAGEKRLPHKNIVKHTKEIENSIYETLPNMPNGTLIVEFVHFDYGKKGNNPLDNLWFYDKDKSLVRVTKEQLSNTVPRDFQEQLIRVFCRDKKFKDVVSKAFENWCRRNLEPFSNYTA